jgi:hypothetical protein
MQIKRFKIIKIKEGKESKNPSLIFIRTPKPNNISTESPPDEIIKIG